MGVIIMSTEPTRLRGLGLVRIDKKFLLNKLEENRKSHKITYENAINGWHLQIIKNLKSELKKAESDKRYQPSFYLAKPDSYIKQYDKTINLLLASLDEEFELTSSDFAKYVLDDWSWKESFMTTVSGCMPS